MYILPLINLLAGISNLRQIILLKDPMSDENDSKGFLKHLGVYFKIFTAL